MQYREMNPEELFRIGEVNRSEKVIAEYIPQPDTTGFGLVAVCTPHHPPQSIPPWGKEGVESRAADWKKQVDRGGFLYGAFDNGRLVGFALLGPIRSDDSIELVALFVDADYRRTGIGTMLMNQVEERALAMGADAMFLYANPTVSSVDFYQKSGFQIIGLISKTIVKSLPGDIVMAKKL